jgi:hypothetical protein
MKWLKGIGIVLLIVLAGIQFIPSGSNQSAVVPSTDFVKVFNINEDIAQTLSNSCYDCHSNHTNYPWYNRVQPISLLLENHIEKAKEELNFSEFASYSSRKQKTKLKSIISQIENDEMPLASYTIIHRNARLSKEKKEALIDYLNSIRKSL